MPDVPANELTDEQKAKYDKLLAEDNPGTTLKGSGVAYEKPFLPDKKTDTFSTAGPARAKIQEVQAGDQPKKPPNAFAVPTDGARPDWRDIEARDAEQERKREDAAQRYNEQSKENNGI